MSAEPVIETRALSKVYRDFWGRQKVRALKALDLEVQPGEVFGLLGPNGSGKTTTIKLLLGLLFPTEGQALVFGKEATDVSKNERIGYLPEESYLYKLSECRRDSRLLREASSTCPPEVSGRSGSGRIDQAGRARRISPSASVSSRNTPRG